MICTHPSRKKETMTATTTKISTEKILLGAAQIEWYETCMKQVWNFVWNFRKIFVVFFFWTISCLNPHSCFFSGNYFSICLSCDNPLHCLIPAPKPWFEVHNDTSCSSFKWESLQLKKLPEQLFFGTESDLRYETWVWNMLSKGRYETWVWNRGMKHEGVS